MGCVDASPSSQVNEVDHRRLRHVLAGSIWSLLGEVDGDNCVSTTETDNSRLVWVLPGLGPVWSGSCLGPVWVLSGSCLGPVWSGSCLGPVWVLSGLGHVWSDLGPV